jgi:archaellum component FlaC
MPKQGGKDYVTKEQLDEAVDTILDGVSNLFDQLRTDVNGVEKRLSDEIKDVKAELIYVKDEINGLKAELSDTPSRREFNELKSRVDEYHPLL